MGQRGKGLTIRSPKCGLGPYIIGYSIIFEAELHKEGSYVTSQDRVLECSPGQWLSLVGSVRSQLGDGLNIQCPFTMLFLFVLHCITKQKFGVFCIFYKALSLYYLLHVSVKRIQVEIVTHFCYIAFSWGGGN